MENKMKNASAMFLTILMLSSFILTYVPPEAEAQVTPDFSLVVSNPSVILDVSPAGTGLGTTSVQVTSSSIHVITVQVRVDVAGFVVSPQVSDVTLASGASVDIGIVIGSNLRSPYQIKNGIVNGRVTRIDGIAVDAGYEQNTGLLVQSRPYGKVILSSDKPFQKVSPGKEYPFKVKVQNNGNSPDSFTVELTNAEKLQDKGFSITLSTTKTADIDQSGVQTVTIQVQTPREFGWKNDYYNLEIRAISDVDKGEDAKYSITTWVYGFGIAGFEPLYSIFALAMIGAFFAKKKND